MRTKYRSWFAVVSAGLVAAVAVISALSTADAQVPSAEQIKMFQSLPQGQRDALLQQLGISPGASGTTAGGTRQDQIVVSQPPSAGADPLAEDAFTGPGDLAREPKIKGRELLMIDLSLPMPVPLPAQRQPGDERAAAEQRPSAADQQTPADRRQAFQQRANADERPTPEERTPSEERKLEALRTRLLTHNPYELSDVGVLQLPGFGPIALAGLTKKEAQRRLALDPQLREFIVTVVVLKIDQQGARALKPFGYDMFRAGATAFVPGTDIPVPANYRVGPGDVLDVQLYGQISKTYTLPVGRDGAIAFPDLGPISLGGMGFGAARSMLENRVRQQLSGTQARVRLADLRSLRVLVLGDAEKPGSYVVSSLASVTNALFASGGVKAIGSLRAVEVRREGQLVRRLDLYEVLLHGNMANDVTLQTGDVVFVPPVGPTVAIDGEVRRPAIYELTNERTLADVVALAGGLGTNADASLVTIERVGEHGSRTSADVNLSEPSGQSFALRTGDIVRIGAVRPVIDNGVALDGHVYRPGMYSWRQGMRLTDVLRSIDDLKPRADEHYVLVRRETADSRRISVTSADLVAALAQPGGAADVPLAPRDRVYVFDLQSPRDRIIDPLLEEIRLQSRPEELAGFVYVDGRINAPGTYPLESGMRISDLLRAGGGLEDAAYANNAELASYSIVDGGRRRADIRQIDLAAARRGDPEANVQLKPYDLLTIKLTPEWERQEKIELVGEVRFPGTYLVRRGETLSSVLERAGGLTSLAFPQGAIFTREELKKREREELDRLARRLQADIATLSLQASQTSVNSAESLSAGQGLLDQLRTTKPVGRLVIDLANITSDAKTRDADVTLRNGDRLVVPRATEEVSVLGEVQNPTAHLFKPGLTRDKVIGLSGGMTAHADKKRTYVVRANGSVLAGSSRWGWGSSGNVALHAGDSVVVPLDAEKMRPLPMWTAITTIVYNLAIAAAAIGRF